MDLVLFRLNPKPFFERAFIVYFSSSPETEVCRVSFLSDHIQGISPRGGNAPRPLQLKTKVTAQEIHHFFGEHRTMEKLLGMVEAIENMPTIAKAKRSIKNSLRGGMQDFLSFANILFELFPSDSFMNDQWLADVCRGDWHSMPGVLTKINGVIEGMPSTQESLHRAMQVASGSADSLLVSQVSAIVKAMRCWVGAARLLDRDFHDITKENVAELVDAMNDLEHAKEYMNLLMDVYETTNGVTFEDKDRYSGPKVRQDIWTRLPCGCSSSSHRAGAPGFLEKPHTGEAHLMPSLTLVSSRTRAGATSRTSCRCAWA